MTKMIVMPVHVKNPVPESVTKGSGAQWRLPMPGTDRVKLSRTVRFGSAGTIHHERGYIGDLRKRGVMVAGGNGLMGSGIAQNFLTLGVPVYLQEKKLEFARMAPQRIARSLQEAVDRKVISPKDGDHAISQIRETVGDITQPDQLAMVPRNLAMMIEAVPEVLEDKLAVLQRMDRHLNPDAILATNTSTLSIRTLAQATSRPDKVIGIHFFKEAQKNRFAEVIYVPNLTSEQTIRRAMTLVRAMGKTPVLCQDSPGAVANRFIIPLSNEGPRILDEGVANMATVDQVVFETIWPTVAKMEPEQRDAIRAKMLLPFSGANQDNYMDIIGHGQQIIHDGLKHRYGDAYKPARTLMEKFQAYEAIARKAAGQGGIFPP